MITKQDVIKFIKTFNPSLPLNVESEIHHLFATVVEEGEIGLNLSRFLAILSDAQLVGSSPPEFKEVKSNKGPFMPLLHLIMDEPHLPYSFFWTAKMKKALRSRFQFQAVYLTTCC